MRTGLDGEALARASRLVAKVDGAAVQDGFDLYLHGFVVADDGKWTVIQQGMNDAGRTARRYHWLSEGLSSFVDSPHAAIEGASRGEIVNLADRRAAASRAGQLDLLRDFGPDRIVREVAEIEGRAAPQTAQPTLPHLVMPAHHEVTGGDVILRRLHGAFAAAAEAGPRDFPELLLVPGIGPRTVRALAQVAEVIHGAPCRFADPARFSFAHGGKDRHPFPVPLAVYDRTLTVLRDAIDRAKLGNDDKMAAFKRLDAESRRLERIASGPNIAATIAAELRASHGFGGMSVFGPEPPVAETATERSTATPCATANRA